MTNAPQGEISPRLRLSILAGISAMLSLSMGMRQSFGLFMGPITHDIAMSMADFTLAIAVQNMAWGLSAPFVGWVADQVGCRRVMLAGATLYCLGTVSIIFATTVAMLILGAGVLIGLALSCTGSSIAMGVTARTSPESRRSAMLGMVSGIGSLGTFIAAPLAQGLIGAMDWRAALWSFAGLAVAMLPLAVMGGQVDRLPSTRADRNTGPAIGTVLARAARHRGYGVTAAAFFVCGLQLVFITTHLPNYLEICGQAPMLGAQAIAVLGGFNVLGSYVFGRLGGRYSKSTLLGLIYLARSAAVALFFTAPVSPASTLGFAAVMGFLWLGVVPLINGLVAQFFGLRFMSTLTGIAFLNHQLGSFLGAWGGGLIYDLLGSYDRAWQAGVGVGLVAGVAQLFVATPSRPGDGRQSR